MGLIHWIRAGVEMPAKRAFLSSMGFRRTRDGVWVSDYNRVRMTARQVRRATLAELKYDYTHYQF